MSIIIILDICMRSEVLQCLNAYVYIRNRNKQLVTSREKINGRLINLNKELIYLITYMKRVQRVSKKRSQTCQICMRKSQDAILLPCNHETCYKCITRWVKIKQNCPFCRSQIQKIQYKSQIKQIQVLRTRKVSKQLDFVMRLPSPSATPENEQPDDSFPISELLASLINEINRTGTLNYRGYFEQRQVQQQVSSSEQHMDNQGQDNTN